MDTLPTIAIAISAAALLVSALAFITSRWDRWQDRRERVVVRAERTVNVSLAPGDGDAIVQRRAIRIVAVNASAHDVQLMNIGVQLAPRAHIPYVGAHRYGPVRSWGTGEVLAARHGRHEYVIEERLDERGFPRDGWPDPLAKIRGYAQLSDDSEVYSNWLPEVSRQLPTP